MVIFLLVYSKGTSSWTARQLTALAGVCSPRTL